MVIRSSRNKALVPSIINFKLHLMAIADCGQVIANSYGLSWHSAFCTSMPFSSVAAMLDYLSSFGWYGACRELLRK